MGPAEALLPEFDQEMATTRKVLERLPDDRFDWKPHDKSMTLGGLATHVANLLQWVLTTLNEDHFDMAPADGEPPRMTPLTSRQEALEKFDTNLAQARATLASCTAEQFMAPWSLLAGGKTVFTLPRAAVLRSMVLSHMIHHRAQLGVYLRLLDVPVPAIYGPSADETPDFGARD